ncbi:uncharacterized protein B0I36DRAFT_364805 [Microdochium trichocladiopsis]|uniref:Abscission/NoCut checkpoint regulator n=1 Tax=Microdochium trichocladiopsis TaxID=1682393 RepID=A0A9P9BNE3_9PEZI|nr:uncharacterized protein B0I36DRAFT_364805 [Microdochium trichocladiopsis]KAH7027626.1 hypothetical protein B0I36DRAFT_364805 [Microdochium trichocladiopsis]
MGDQDNKASGPKGSDKALLDRLNALKPTNVTLDSSSSTSITPASTIERVKPPSREDALSDRLKSLRSQIGAESEASTITKKDSGSQPLHTAKNAAPTKDAPLQPPSSGKGTTITSTTTSVASAPAPTGVANADDDDDDPLLSMTDDQTLEDLLADLESDQQWVEEVAAAEEQEQHRKAMALLEELSPGKDGAAVADDDGDDDGDGDSEHAASKVRTAKKDGDESDSDNSDGDAMAREADDLIARAMDEIELERKNGVVPSPGYEGDPAVMKDTATLSNDTSNNKDEDFAASIASRMAALNVSTPSASHHPQHKTQSNTTSLPSVPATEPDPFAALLPSAPTFSPQDPAAKPAVVTGVLRRTARRGGAYTDEDQKSWCTVCLDDATIRCLGCDDDGAGGNVYCERCWREMHVGPMAGFDDLGHKWEKFERGR